jgi:hypothetical protein
MHPQLVGEFVNHLILVLVFFRTFPSNPEGFKLEQIFHGLPCHLGRPGSSLDPLDPAWGKGVRNP